MSCWQELKARQQMRASEILPFLFVASAREASDLDYLQGLGITHILNVADDVPNYHTDHFEYSHLPVRDFGQDQGISRIFEDAKAFVLKATVLPGHPDKQLQNADAPSPDQAKDTSTDTTQGLPAAMQGAARQSKVLVHCAAGCNRSVTVCIALLMMLEGYRLRDAFVRVKSRRPGAWPMRDNLQQLVDFEARLFGSNSVTIEDLSGSTRKMKWLTGNEHM